jgi:hypothetical protein
VQTATAGTEALERDVDRGYELITCGYIERWKSWYGGRIPSRYVRLIHPIPAKLMLVAGEHTHLLPVLVCGGPCRV